MTESDNQLRAEALGAFEAVSSLDDHGEVVRLILVEASLLSQKYRNVRRHDVPHITELTGLLDLLWQEVEMNRATSPALAGVRSEMGSLPLFSSETGSAKGLVTNRPVRT